MKQDMSDAVLKTQRWYLNPYRRIYFPSKSHFYHSSLFRDPLLYVFLWVFSPECADGMGHCSEALCSMASGDVSDSRWGLSVSGSWCWWTSGPLSQDCTALLLVSSGQHCLGGWRSWGMSRKANHPFHPFGQLCNTEIMSSSSGSF